MKSWRRGKRTHTNVETPPRGVYQGEKMADNNEINITELMAEIVRLNAELEKAKERERDLEETRKAMLYMLEDMNESGKRLEISKKEWEETFDAISDPIFIHDNEFRIVKANRAYQEASGMPFKEIIGKPYHEVFPRMDNPHKTCLNAHELQEEQQEEVFLPSMDKIFKTRFYPIRDVNGKPLYSIHVLEDITERKQAEDMLCKQREELQIIIDSSPVMIFYKDNENRFIRVNKALSNAMALPKESLEGKSCFDIYPPLQAESYWKDDKEVIASGQAKKNIIEQFVAKEGMRWVQTDKIPYRDEKGNIIGLIGFAIDITVRKQAEENIKKLNSLLLSIREINKNLLRIKAEKELFVKICDTLVKLNFIKFVWIGLIEKGNFDIKPVAQAGFEEGFLSSLKIRWDDSEYGSGPSGTAIKTGKPVIVKDIENDPICKPWRNNVKKLGSMSGVAIPLKYDSDMIGVLSTYSDRKDAFGEEEIDFLKEVAVDIAVGVKSLRLENKLAQGLEETKKALNGTIQAISLMGEMRDPYTAGHEKRVAELSCAIAKEIGFTEDRIEGIRISGFLHDIGKIVVPAEILSKPTKLNEYEYGIIKTHPQVGYDVLKGLEFPWPVAQATLQHQERLNGSGYPAGLKGEEIIVEARILAVADVVEAMMNHRPYRPALGIDKAMEEITRNKGVLYDPRVVDACLKLFKENGFRFMEKT